MTDQALWHRWREHEDATAFKEIADKLGSARTTATHQIPQSKQ